MSIIPPPPPLDSEENKENASKNEKPDLPAEVRKILTAVPENKREELETAINRIISVQVSRKISTTHYRGPFPPPEILKGMKKSFLELPKKSLSKQPNKEITGEQWKRKLSLRKKSKVVLDNGLAL